MASSAQGLIATNKIFGLTLKQKNPHKRALTLNFLINLLRAIPALRPSGRIKNHAFKSDPVRFVSIFYCFL